MSARLPLVLLFFALAPACERDRPIAPREVSRASSASGDPVDALDEDDVAPPSTTRRARMHERFESVDIARSALQRGDLSATRTVASTIAFRMPIDLPPAVRAHGDAVPRRALALSAAEDLDAAGAAFAQLVGTCGGCHAEAGATWSWPDTPVPEGEDIEQRMQRHAWANERLWEALLTRDAARFDRAAEILAEAPLSGERGPDEERPAGIRAIEERLHDAARDASRATTMDERIERYGRIVARCGECHARLR